MPTTLRDVLRGVSARGFAPLKESCNLFFLDKSDALMIRETCPSLNPRQVCDALAAHWQCRDEAHTHSRIALTHCYVYSHRSSRF